MTTGEDTHGCDYFTSLFLLPQLCNSTRPTNSSLNVYRLSDEALSVVQAFQTDSFTTELDKYIKKSGTLKARYARARKLSRFEVKLPDGAEVSLKTGGQNDLIKAMIEEFAPQFIPEGQVLYIGDADNNLVVYEKDALEQLGISLDSHGKMPDLIVYQPNKNWLFLMEACSTHGPIDNSRYTELESLFGGSSAGLVYVSCFPDRQVLRKFLADLAWETEAWVAEEPTHLMHLNGTRFLGPYN